MQNKTTNLPQTVSEFKDALKVGIEFYQGNPAKNNNKLNEAVAKSLGFKNYDQLSALIYEDDVKVSRHTATINDNNEVFIDGQLINSVIFDEEMVDYKVRTKDEVVDDICDYLGYSSLRSERWLLLEDLKLLTGDRFQQDEYILTSILTNHYLSRHVYVDEFDDFCEEVLEINKSLSIK